MVPKSNILPVLLFFAWLIGAGCEKQEDTTLPTQQSQMESFLRDRHAPRLATYEEAVEALENEGDTLEFYRTVGPSTDRKAYCFIADYYDDERRLRTEIEKGDLVQLTYRIYIFNNAPIAPEQPPLYTNDPTFIAKYDNGLNPTYWSSEPLEMTVGAGSIFKGVDLSLPGCRELDSLGVYMPFNMAYGGGLVGSVPRYAPIVVSLNILSVEKQRL